METRSFQFFRGSMYSLWSSFRAIALGLWTPRNEVGVMDTKEGVQNDVVETRNMNDYEDEDEDEDEADDDDDEDTDDEADDSDGGNEDDNLPVVTVHPDCGFEVDTSFYCPLNTESRFTLAATYSSAKSGCPCCIVQYAAIKGMANELSDTTEIYGSHDSVFMPFWIQDQEFVFAWADDEDDKVIKMPPYDDPDDIPYYKFYGEAIGGGLGLVERVVPCDTSSPKTVARVQKWIKDCNEGHDCTQDSSTKLPRRVLDVRNGQIKLRDTTPEDHGAKYACVSHCWGTPPTEIERVCTTPATIMDYYHQGIPYEVLPRTFQDAVSFSRKLDVPYLWIDSFCIIQKEPGQHDWQVQSADMANIYRNAYITLSAAVSTNPLGGCYPKGNAPRLHQIGSPLATLTFEDGTERNIFSRRKFKHVSDSLPLLHRGWVYQERTLSPRVLHFIGEELLFECRHTLDCECGADGLENKFERIRLWDDADNSVVGPNGQHNMPMKLWYQVISEYTQLSLSYSSDALPALSGIAKYFAAKIGDEYVAGMWKGTLVSNLLWYFMEEPDDVTTSDHVTTPWTAPSWSWASRPFKSSIPRAHFLPVTKELAQVKDIVCEPSGADPTGGLKTTAHLTLVTKAVSASLEYSDSRFTIILGQDFKISKSPPAYLYDDSNLATGYLDLDEPKNGPLHILLAQIACCTTERRAYLYGHDMRIPFQQEIRHYMLLAKHNEHWNRIGLATIAEYEPDTAWYGCEYGSDARTLDPDKKAAIIGTKTPDELKALLEERAVRNRAIFQRFDESETQDLVVW
jgi:hypothetical protein